MSRPKPVIYYMGMEATNMNPVTVMMYEADKIVVLAFNDRFDSKPAHKKTFRRLYEAQKYIRSFMGS